MTTTFRTVVLELPPTPLGLLSKRWLIEHWCNNCGRKVASDDLLAHAQAHDAGSSMPLGLPATGSARASGVPPTPAAPPGGRWDPGQCGPR
jgi:hypothetical protein